MKRKSLFLCLVLLLTLASCNNDDSKDYPVIAVSVNEDLGCVELVREGIVYRPYGVSPPSLRGAQIGIREDHPDISVHEVKGYDASEWLIDHLDVFMGGGDGLYKAVGVADIPAELTQYKEYDF